MTGALDLAELFAPNDPPPVVLLREYRSEDREVRLTAKCVICRDGWRVSIDRAAIADTLRPLQMLADYARDIMLRPHVCPDHDPGDEDRS